MRSVSPYHGLLHTEWAAKTEELIQAHPLSTEELVEVTLQAWEQIFDSSIGGVLRIGNDIAFPQQIMGNILQRLIAYELAKRYPGVWRGEENAEDKDLVYIPDSYFSFEVKSSTNPNSIYGNRSYGQPSETGRKSKSGYYLAVNCQPFSEASRSPKITKIRFGWLDFTDWIAQKSATGQQASLTREANSYKLRLLYSIK